MCQDTAHDNDNDASCEMPAPCQAKSPRSPSLTHADLMFMELPMTQTSPAEFQSDRRHTETDSTLRLSRKELPKKTHKKRKMLNNPMHDTTNTCPCDCGVRAAVQSIARVGCCVYGVMRS